MDLCEFRERYSLTLNDQQAQAVETVDGPVLLLAVPGSGKTTVLVARLGYMILCRGLDPASILAVTYTRAAAADMRKRYIRLFGDDPAILPEFRTINGLCAKILDRYARKYRRSAPVLLENEAQRTAVVRQAAQKYADGYLSESELQEYSSGIGYIKNMQLDADGIRKLDAKTSHISQVYADYQAILKAGGMMDYDDQMVFALQILKALPPLLEEYRAMFPYLCVDEAQDTSKLQHEIIALLAQESRNLFMVGDEDQSIYGFRGAWPEALLNFRARWPEAVVLPLETNYRSTKEIVAAADAFITKNEGRYEKHMTAARGSGPAIERQDFPRRYDQYQLLLEKAEKLPDDTAVLYRDNDCAIPLMDLLLRNGIPFRPLQIRTTFFTHKVTQDITDFFHLAEDPYNAEAFLRIYYKFRIEGLYIRKEQAERAAGKVSTAKKVTVFDALAACYPSGGDQRQSVWSFRSRFAGIADLVTTQAIDRICTLGYRSYLEHSRMDTGKLDLLKGLAAAEPDQRRFLSRLKELRLQLEAPECLQQEKGIILSTIHSAKGLEFGTVYLMDLFDGLLPAVMPDRDTDDEAAGEQYAEERRLFYVGITRAKDRLTLLTVRNKDASFADELCPLKGSSLPFPVSRPKVPVKPAGPSPVRTFTDPKQRQAARDAEEERRLRAGYEEVRDRFTQQDTPIYDSFRRRWVKCGMCGKIKPASEFAIYGGDSSPNLGRCCECSDRINRKHEKY